MWHPPVLPVRRWLSFALCASQALALVLALAAIADFALPGQGMTQLISFGSRFADQALPAVRNTPHFIIENSAGYDGQFYAQVAMDPLLRDEALPKALDNFSYRTRRIFMPALSHAAGLGQPALILQAYALINVAAWLALAVVLFHWFRPGDPQGWLRWFGVLFGAGFVYSIRNALPDGPALLLIAVGLVLVERNRMGSGAFGLALATLTRETSALAAVVLAPESGWRNWPWRRLLLAGTVVVLPIGLWLVYVYSRGVALALDRSLGAGNFSWPFLGLWGAWLDTFRWEDWTSRVWVNRVAMMLGLTVQMGFFLCRWRPGERIWRLGFTASLLGLVLGSAVWEGYPVASVRVLLPLTLAFNLAVPRGRLWLPLLLAGNLSVIAAPSALTAPNTNRLSVVSGPDSLVISEGEPAWRIEFGSMWYPLEHSGRRQWRWAPNSAVVVIENRSPRTVEAVLSLGLRARVPCELTIGLDGDPRWTGQLGDEEQAVDLAVRLAPGPTVVSFDSPEAPVVASWQDEREILFRLTRFELGLRGTAVTRE